MKTEPEIPAAHCYETIAMILRVRSSSSMFTNQPDPIDTLCYIPLREATTQMGGQTNGQTPTGFLGILVNFGLRKSLKENGDLVRRVRIEPTT
jgi:hypothetical protein